MNGSAAGQGGLEQTEISEAQRLQLALIHIATFNLFDGDRVVDDLLAHRELWEAALMTRDDLIPLRDLPIGWIADTLYILARPGYKEALERLASEWLADSTRWIT
jgi:hypothetical protein